MGSITESKKSVKANLDMPYPDIDKNGDDSSPFSPQTLGQRGGLDIMQLPQNKDSVDPDIASELVKINQN